jgi:hypothetical protein
MALVNGNGVIRRKPRASAATARRLDRLARMAELQLCVGNCCQPVNDALDALSAACGSDAACRKAVARMETALAEAVAQSYQGTH